MFGSATWWLFFTDGYRALDLPDDNRDGLLTGRELKGICVGFDHNSDGQSDRGEIIPIGGLDITAIATRPTGRDGKSPMHRAGIRLQDEGTLPTYDGIAPWANRPRKTPP